MLTETIKKIENVIQLRARNDATTEKDITALEEYMGISQKQLESDLKFYKQLTLGYIKLPNFKYDKKEIQQLYESASFGSTGKGEYRDIQGYAQVPTPKFVQEQFIFPMYKSNGFLRAKENKAIPSHVDMGRVAAILIPFVGEQDKNPLRFWKNDNKTLISETLIDQPTLINTTIYHSVDTASSKQRINFTICFDYPYSFEVLADLFVRKQMLERKLVA